MTNNKTMKVNLAMRKGMTMEFRNEYKLTWEHAERRGWFCTAIEPITPTGKVVSFERLYKLYNGRKSQRTLNAVKRLSGKVVIDRPKPYLKELLGGKNA